MDSDLLTLPPVPALLARVRAELSASFALDRPIRVCRAPGRLDVMGGIADYTGSLVCEATLDRAAAVALQSRDDREVQIFSFNLLDEHKPFTIRIPLDALANNTAEVLRRDFAAPGRQWAGYVAGCLFLLHERGYVNLRNPAVRGVNIAVLSTVPAGASVSSSAALEVAAMMNVVDHFGIPRAAHSSSVAMDAATSNATPDQPLAASRLPAPLTPMDLAAMCQSVENRIVGAPCGIMDQATSCLGEAGSLLRMICQPHELLPPLALPPGVRVVGIDSGVRHSVGGGQYGRTRCAAFMGHRIILDTMRRIGASAGRSLAGDPMNGYLANLDPDDYKRIFRPALPETIKGGTFLIEHGPTVDAATQVEPDHVYPIVHATDHHVLEARRVRNFAAFLESAAALPIGSRERKLQLDKAGHLMYASHLSYTNDAMLGADECDLLVKLVREREPEGLYGARITGGGSGGTVAVLADDGDRAATAIAQIVALFQDKAARRADVLSGSSPGAWRTGSVLV